MSNSDLFPLLSPRDKAEIAFRGLWARWTPEVAFWAACLGGVAWAGSPWLASVLRGGEEAGVSGGARLLMICFIGAAGSGLATVFSRALASWGLSKLGLREEERRLGRLQSPRHWAYALAGLALGPAAPGALRGARWAGGLSEMSASAMIFFSFALWALALALSMAAWVAAAASSKRSESDPRRGVRWLAHPLVWACSASARRWSGFKSQVVESGMRGAERSEWERRAVRASARKAPKREPGATPRL